MKLFSKTLVAVGLAATFTSQAAIKLDSQAQKPYHKGQVVVKGQDIPAGSELIQYLPNADLSIIKVKPGKELALVKKEREKGKFAHVNLKVKASSVPNDPYMKLQWQWHNINAKEGWQINAGENAVVAVLDTGLASGGNDGINCVVSPYSAVNGDTNVHDLDGHGTHVAGTVAQSAFNGVGGAGLAYNSCVMPVQVLDANGNGSMAHIADGIYHAVANGADVINMSLGTPASANVTSDPLLDPALKHAYQNNVVLVAASGNDGDRRRISYPAASSYVISVGATDFNNNRVAYSNQSRSLDLVAPGGDLNNDRNGDGYADGILQETFLNGAFGYYFYQGTSMAAPHVAALAAMVKSAGVALTSDEVKDALTSTATDLYGEGKDKETGYGLINVYGALQYTPSTPDANEPSSCTDADGDGVCVEDGDCNDNDANINPLKNDSKGKWGRNGIDNNCNGVIDG